MMSEEPGGTARRDRRAASRAAGVARRRRIVDGVAKSIGVGIALVGAGMLTIAAVDLATGGDSATPRATLAGLIVLCGAMSWWGLLLGWPELGPGSLARRFRARRADRQARTTGLAQPATAEVDERERAVLRLAEQEQGRVTVLEAAGRCDLTVEEAKALLDALVLRTIAQLHVSEEGVLVYVFPSFEPGASRRRKTSPPSPLRGANVDCVDIISGAERGSE
jgi:hypothetical protein